MEIFEYETIPVTEVEIETADLYQGESRDNGVPPLLAILELISFLPLSDQAIMMANLLTISGYEQKEISEAMGMNYINYRKRLFLMRREFERRGLDKNI